MGFAVVAVLFLLAMIGLARPYIGLLSFLIVMELQPGELYPYLAPLHLERVIAGMLILSFLLHGAKLRVAGPMKWFLAFYGAMLASIPLAFWRANSAQSCYTFLEIVVYVVMTATLLTTESRIRWFILTDVLLVDWLGGSALWNYAHGIWEVRMHIERAIGITSSAGDPNTMATTLLISLPFSFLLMNRSNPKWMRLIGLASIAMSLVTIVDTGSRSGALGVIFLLLLLIFRKKKNLIYIPILVALSPVVWSVIPQQYKARYETVDHLKNDDSYQNRILSWQGGVGMFLSNPLTGVGPGNYAIANGEKFWPGEGRKKWLDAHSLYFKLIGELGLLGIITFVGYLVSVFRLNFRLRRRLRDAPVLPMIKELPGMLSIMLCQLLFAGYGAHDLYRSMWFVVGALSISLSLLPQLQEQTAGTEMQPLDAKENSIDWSPALLPVLRTPVSTENPRG